MPATDEPGALGVEQLGRGGSRDGAAVERYARATAQLHGLRVEEAWWAGVTRHLSRLLALSDGIPVNPTSDGPDRQPPR